MKRRNYWLALHRAALRGKLARRLGLELRHNPYRGKTGFGRGLVDAWADGWREEARDIASAAAIEKYFANSPGAG